MKVSRQTRAVPTVQVAHNCESDGFCSNMPFMNRRTKGCDPRVCPSARVITDPSAELAVLMGLYPIPVW